MPSNSPPIRGDLNEAADGLAAIWENIEFEDVFRVDVGSLLRNSVLWLARLALGGSRLVPRVRGLLNTAPLRRLLERELRANDGEIEGVARNLATYGTGQTVTWAQGGDIEGWERPERRAHTTRLTVDHVMASSTLPLVFPAIELDDGWYGDGSIRLAAPLSPALHLGADRILAVSTRYPRSRAETDRPYQQGYPSPAQIAGNLMNAIFLDLVDQDVLRLERLNEVVRQVPPDQRRNLKPLGIHVVRPSRDLGKMSAGFEPRLPTGFRFLTRGLGTRESTSPDFLSLLMFHPEYLRELIALGVRDVEARRGEIEAVIAGGAGRIAGGAGRIAGGAGRIAGGAGRISG